MLQGQAGTKDPCALSRAPRPSNHGLAAIIWPDVGRHAFDAMAFDAVQHISDRVGPGLAASGRLVVMQVRVQQGLCVVSRLRQ